MVELLKGVAGIERVDWLVGRDLDRVHELGAMAVEEAIELGHLQGRQDGAVVGPAPLRILARQKPQRQALDNRAIGRIAEAIEEEDGQGDLISVAEIANLRLHLGGQRA